jgi:hypothetical protein
MLIIPSFERQQMKKFFGLAVVAMIYGLLTSGTANGAVIFDLANASNLALSHSSAAPAAAPPVTGSASVGIGTFSWGILSTDSTVNTAEFSAGLFASSDWGGQGTFTSTSLDVSNSLTADITGVYSGQFNTGTEFSNFFYVLDGGTPQLFGIGVEDANATDVAVSVAGLDVTSANSLVVGFDFSHNGASDSFDVSSFSVNVTAVPEPSCTVISILAVGGCLARRRRQRTGAV